MSGMNPVIMIQLMMQYNQQAMQKDCEGRTFTFTKHNQLKVHKETPDEIKKRKSILSPSISKLSEDIIRQKLCETLKKNNIGYVYVDPRMRNIAVPISEQASQNGFGVLAKGSRIDIPIGKKIRAFTYWEKVNDIDLSCFGIEENGTRHEFSWRTMSSNQSSAISFSGDETSGYKGGSEYFDIDLDAFMSMHPLVRYIFFCDNVFSGTPFDECLCKAGFMMRDIQDSGEVFEPKTVTTSFRIDCKSTFAYLFAIDLKKRQMIWLNAARKSRERVAGNTELEWLKKYTSITDVFNVYDLYTNSGKPVHDIIQASIVVTDDIVSPEILGNRIQIHSWDTDKMLALLNPS